MLSDDSNHNARDVGQGSALARRAVSSELSQPRLSGEDPQSRIERALDTALLALLCSDAAPAELDGFEAVRDEALHRVRRSSPRLSDGPALGGQVASGDDS